jgi:hypothetical protein
VSLCATLRLRSAVRFWSGQGKLVTSFVVRARKAKCRGTSGYGTDLTPVVSKCVDWRIGIRSY